MSKSKTYYAVPTRDYGVCPVNPKGMNLDAGDAAKFKWGVIYTSAESTPQNSTPNLNAASLFDDGTMIWGDAIVELKDGYVLTRDYAHDELHVYKAGRVPRTAYLL